MKVLRKLGSIILCCCLLGVFMPQQVFANETGDEINYQASIGSISPETMSLQTGEQGAIGISKLSFTPALPVDTQEVHPDQYTTEYITYSYEIRWSSSDESIVSIDESNTQYSVFVNAINPGKATVSAHLIL